MVVLQESGIRTAGFRRCFISRGPAGRIPGGAPGCLGRSCMATSRARGIASWRLCRVGAFPTGIAKAQWSERN